LIWVHSHNSSTALLCQYARTLANEGALTNYVLLRNLVYQEF
jgi:hypothetical protein